MVEICVPKLICGSITKNGDNLNVQMGDGYGDFGSENTINSRQENAWDD